MRKRKIKKYGGSCCIHLTVEDMKDLELKEDDEVDIEDLVKIKKK